MGKNIGYDDRNDKLLTFKISLIPYLMKAWHKNSFEISAILEQYRLLPYIDASYEIYQTMGVQGIIEDLEEFIDEQGGCVHKRKNPEPGQSK